MFGYIKPYKPEMKIKEFSGFRAEYCGVCKAMKAYSHISRAGISYDATLFALMKDALSDENPIIKSEGCVLNPFVKKPIVSDSIGTKLGAALNVMLIYHKLKDDIEDDNDIKAKVGLTVLRSGYKKASSEYPEIAEIIENGMKAQHDVEINKEHDLDRAAHPFAVMIQEILSIDAGADGKMLGWMGYHTGKWIYYMDAISDIEEDINDKGYNPVILKFGGYESDAGTIRENAREDISFLLNSSLNEIAKSYELLEVKRYGGVLDNIFFEGMGRATASINETGGISLKNKFSDRFVSRQSREIGGKIDGSIYSYRGVPRCER